MTLCRTNVKDTRPKAVWGPKRGWFIKLALASLLVTPSLASGASGASWVSGEGQTLQQHGQAHDYKLDDVVSQRAGGNPGLTSRVIVTLAAGAELPPEFRKYARGAKLDVLNGHVLEVPNGVLSQLAKHPNVFRVHDDRPVYAHNYVTSSTVGAVAARQKYGYTGAGVGVAVIDSGISTWHDDLTINTFQSQSGITALPHPYGNQRVAKFVDLVNGQTQPYDDNGHGTHVAGVIAGNGFDSSGQKAGMAPDASIISLKVLNANGAGTVSNVIAALGWIAANASAYNIRVVNLSVGAPIRESYLTDPLTLAAKAVTDLGIVVVAAAGNLGRNSSGQSQWGGITAPGNAPWVLTVGASSTMGTTTRGDDTLGGFSSRGPSSIDFLAKPDLVAPGTGTVSLAVPGSTLYINKPSMLVKGTLNLGVTPYLSLSGTSMAAPVVAGTAALMLQANPSLTPNLVKAILQYTAEVNPGYKPLEQGAGFLDAYGAVRLARFYAKAQPGDTLWMPSSWGKRIVWGNHLLTGGTLLPSSSAWATTTIWGSARTPSQTSVSWGVIATSLDNIVWGTSAADNIVWGTALSGDNIVWGTDSGADNIVWGTDCGGADCNVLWGTYDALDNIVWGTASLGDNIVWGTVGVDNIVWGTASLDNIVWGTSGLDNIVWGTSTALDVLWPSDSPRPTTTTSTGGRR